MKIPADTLLNSLNREQREQYEQGGLQGTLRLNSMNREQRERYEQGGLQGTLRFSGEKGELSLRGKPNRDTPFEFYEPRTTRRVRTRRSRA